MCLKIVWDRANFEGERQSRGSAALDSDRVVEVLAYVTPEGGVEEVGGAASASGGVVGAAAGGGGGEAKASPPGDAAAPDATATATAAIAKTTTGAPSWEHARPEYAVVMPRAEGNLDVIVRSERFAGHDPLKARLVLVDLAKALQHMHAQGLVHALSLIHI